MAPSIVIDAVKLFACTPIVTIDESRTDDPDDAFANTALSDSHVVDAVVVEWTRPPLLKSM
jgi:hypothetical protein